MSQQNRKFIFTHQELVGRPAGWTGDLIAGVYPIDVEYAVFMYLGNEKWTSWRKTQPTQLDQVVSYIQEKIVDNMVIDAKLDEYVSDALQEVSN